LLVPLQFYTLSDYKMSYEKRGVSANKEDVHSAIADLSKGLYNNSFCKILPDFFTQDDDYACMLHADTAGSKTALAYLYWKETGDITVWQGITQDAIVMNTDDMACSGVTDNIMLSNTIGRNKALIPGNVVAALIQGATQFADLMLANGIKIHLAGGETADVGDIVRTLDVGFTAFARLPKSDIQLINIQPGQVVIGVESYGQASYESEYNSGIGSNGLTFARHEVLSAKYRRHTESYAPETDSEYVYSGSKSLSDIYEGQLVAKLLLSPTRTYLPVLKMLFQEKRAAINGIIHNTGGGQTKVLHFAKGVNIVKNDLLEIPPVFNMIQSENNTAYQEMFKIFNMGQRLEIYTNKEEADSIINIIKSFDINAKIIGYVEEHSNKNASSVEVHAVNDKLLYHSS